MMLDRMIEKLYERRYLNYASKATWKEPGGAIANNVDCVQKVNLRVNCNRHVLDLCNILHEEINDLIISQLNLCVGGEINNKKERIESKSDLGKTQSSFPEGSLILLHFTEKI